MIGIPTNHLCSCEVCLSPNVLETVYRGPSVMGDDFHILRTRAEARRMIRRHNAGIDWHRGRGGRRRQIWEILGLTFYEIASLFQKLRHRELNLCWAFEHG